MKTLRISAALLLATLMFSCGTTEPSESPNTMKATIDNTTWESVEVSAVREGGLLSLTGVNAIGDQLRFTIFPDGPGDYPLGQGKHAGSFADEFSEWWAFGFGAGNLTILVLDDERVAGYFGFRGKDTATGKPSRTIASGTFDIAF